jgi:hypothetical protein
MSLNVIKASFSGFSLLACVYPALQALVAKSVEKGVRGLPLQGCTRISMGSFETTMLSAYGLFLEELATGTLMRDNESREKEHSA